MSGLLETICAEKRSEIERRKTVHPLEEVVSMARVAPPPRGFADRLRGRVAAGAYGLIGEIKRASPSRGLIRPDFDPAALARAYREGGATCLSVLTHRLYFEGDGPHLAAAHDAVDLPVLHKDFLVDPYQAVEARALGADCILIIMAALGDAQAHEIETTALERAMDVLVEVHDERDLDRALLLRSRLIGINNRDLNTLEVDLATTERLCPRLPREALGVSESGLATAADLHRMHQAGIGCFLIGEALLRQPDVARATAALLEGSMHGDVPQQPAQLDHG